MTGANSLDYSGAVIRHAVSALGILTALAMPGFASAQAEPTPEDIDTAAVVERFDEAQQLYRDGRFAEAAEALRELIAIRPEPVLHYNLARAYDGNGELAEAIASYERYLELVPEVADRGAIEKRMATLKAQLAERERLAKRTATPPPPPSLPADEGGSTAVPWVMVGVGAATVIAGIVLGSLSASQRSTAEDATVHAEAAGALDRAKGFALGANISFVAGSLLTAAGATWLIVDAAAGPGVASDEVGVRITWRL